MKFAALCSLLAAVGVEAQVSSISSASHSASQTDRFPVSSSSLPSSSSSSSSSSSASGNAFSSNVVISVTPIGSTITDPSVAVPTGSYLSLTGNITLTPSVNGTASLNSFIITGGSTVAVTSPSSASGPTKTTTTTSSTTTTAAATNTQPCNNYVEFCTRQYSNITEVAAHNAAFVRPNNAFSNQAIGIIGQLNDGVRMIQGEVHYENGTLLNCHTSCAYLNTGTYESLLVTVRDWIQANPYNVVTLLIANSNGVDVSLFEEPFQNSGILDYVFVPPQIPMRRSDWPTLEQMILANHRVVVFMDYMANASVVPYIIDQYSSIWETPFSPTDPAFPCTEQRPPNLSADDARNNYMYLANHNLNVQVKLLGFDVLIPDFSQLALVNADNSSSASLLTMGQNCQAMWGRPPNFLVVDFYNVGSGSVFEVAAKLNNVTYHNNCCGEDDSLNAAARLLLPSRLYIGTLLVASLTALMFLTR